MMTPSEARLAYQGRAAELNVDIVGPKGEYRVELQDDGRWTVEQISNGPPVRMVNLIATNNMGSYETRKDAIYAAERYAMPHPLPDRRAAIAHTKAKL